MLWLATGEGFPEQRFFLLAGRAEAGQGWQFSVFEGP